MRQSRIVYGHVKPFYTYVISKLPFMVGLILPSFTSYDGQARMAVLPHFLLYPLQLFDRRLNILIDEMPGEAARAAHLIAVDFGKYKILFEQFCLYDDVSVRRNNFRPSPKIDAIFISHPITKHN